ncbi:hypothetical protein PybrP1_008189 [[Pythium] brassicae (nom. inval.)]|nr:hypothetical protein PybrP1_008189 [[Pythium] brassicae (nom. inval.)]
MANGFPCPSPSSSATASSLDGVVAANTYAAQAASRPTSPHTSALCTTQRSRSHPTAHNGVLIEASALPSPRIPQRAVSYPETVALAVRRHRVRIQYHDEALRERSQANIRQLLQSGAATARRADSVAHESPLTTSELLARKALKYRHVLERLRGVDVSDPTFDASEFLGVEWCKCVETSPSAQRPQCARASTTVAA